MLRLRRRPTPAPTSGFTSPHAVPPTDLLGWAALSLAADQPTPTGNAPLDMHNDAISIVQAYLNGRALAAETDEEKAYLLRLRANLNFLYVPATDDDDPADDPADDLADDLATPDAGEEFYEHCGCDQHGDHGGCTPACADNFGCARPETTAA